jgi:precorrin-3B synthase
MPVELSRPPTVPTCRFAASASSHAALIDSLLAAGLGPRTAAGDDVRNLMLSPAAGLDRQMLFDTRALAGQILDTLQSHPRFHELSAKFAVQLDGGEALAMLEHPHDLWLSAFERDGEVLLGFGLAGCPTDRALGAVSLENGHALVVAVLELFLDLARPEQTRMRHLLDELPMLAFLEQLRARVPIKAVSGWQRISATDDLHIGAHPQNTDGLLYVGAVPPLGRLDPSMLRGAAQLARQFGDGSLRFTPWQSLLLPNVRTSDAAEVLEGLEQLKLLTRSAEPLSRLIACTGSNGCGKGWLTPRARCTCNWRHCCHPANLERAPVRLLAFVRRRAPCPGDFAGGRPRSLRPLFSRCTQPGFGALHAHNLTIEAVALCSTPAHGAPLMLDYIRDGQEIYRNSFAIIRAEANLSRIPADLEKLAVRVIHACGMVDAIDGLQFSEGAGKAGRDALAAGAPILCDARMVSEGVTRARLPANNQVICTLRDESVPELARELGNTRSAAALELWRPHLEGSVVVIGNAPTALFYLLEMLDAGAPKPALILGFPVGFVGAAESKACWPRTAAVCRSSSCKAGSAAAPWPPPPSMPSPRRSNDAGQPGRLIGLGVGPGDPELITVKALRLLRESPVVAYFVAKGKKGNAFGIIEAHLQDAQTLLPLVYPVTTEALPAPLSYEQVISDFYDDRRRARGRASGCGSRRGGDLRRRSVLLRLLHVSARPPRHALRSEVVPGVCSMLGGASVLGAPLVYRNQSLSVLVGRVAA